jgi:hypothetical protein
MGVDQSIGQPIDWSINGGSINRGGAIKVECKCIGRGILETRVIKVSRDVLKIPLKE